MSNVEQLASYYKVNINTILFLVDLYGVDTVEERITLAIKKLGNVYKDADLIRECMEIDKEPTPGPEIDTSFLLNNEDADKINTLNTILGYIITTMFAIIGCTFTSILLHISFKYLAGFLIILFLFYKMFSLINISKRHSSIKGE